MATTDTKVITPEDLEAGPFLVLLREFARHSADDLSRLMPKYAATPQRVAGNMRRIVDALLEVEREIVLARTNLNLLAARLVA